MFGEVGDGGVEAVGGDEVAVFVAGVADGADDAEEVEADEGLFGLQLVDCAGEEGGVGEGSGDGRGEAEELLQGFEEVLEGVGFGLEEAVDYGVGEGGDREEVLFYSGGFFLEPASG